MAKPCEASKGERGVFVKTWSGSSGQAICSLGGHSAVRHYVEVENLRLYPSDVKCKGYITSDPRLLKFTSSNPSDTDATWNASIKKLAGGLNHTFAPCILNPLPGAVGPEIVHAEVTIEWALPAKRDTISLSIKVST
jgi:hypothetical protein